MGNKGSASSSYHKSVRFTIGNSRVVPNAGLLIASGMLEECSFDDALSRFTRKTQKYSSADIMKAMLASILTGNLGLCAHFACVAMIIQVILTVVQCGNCHPRSRMILCILPLSVSDAGPKHDADGASRRKLQGEAEPLRKGSIRSKGVFPEVRDPSSS